MRVDVCGRRRTATSTIASGPSRALDSDAPRASVDAASAERRDPLRQGLAVRPELPTRRDSFPRHHIRRVFDAEFLHLFDGFFARERRERVASPPNQTRSAAGVRASARVVAARSTVDAPFREPEARDAAKRRTKRLSTRRASSRARTREKVGSRSDSLATPRGVVRERARMDATHRRLRLAASARSTRGSRDGVDAVIERPFIARRRR